MKLTSVVAIAALEAALKQLRITATAKQLPEIKNIVIHKDLKTYDNLIFLDKNDQNIDIKNFKEKLVLLNFWATWCEPCKEEMPSLDRLQNNPQLSNLKIFVINISQENLEKVNDFLKELNIKNLEPYFDNPKTLAKKLSLRGVPTSVLFNGDSKEFARIIGSLDFDDLKFIEWLKKYN